MEFNEFDFNNPNFDRESYLAVSGFVGLDNISNFLNYGIHTTITKQLGNIPIENEQYYAQQILMNYFKGDKHFLTSTNGIRETIGGISNTTLKMMLCKTAIEYHAFCKRVYHHLDPLGPEETYSADVVDNAISGNLKNSLQAMENNDHMLCTLIDVYTKFTYGSTKRDKDIHWETAINNPAAERALEQLNLELSLYKNKGETK